MTKLPDGPLPPDAVAIVVDKEVLLARLHSIDELRKLMVGYRSHLATFTDSAVIELDIMREWLSEALAEMRK